MANKPEISFLGGFSDGGYCRRLLNFCKRIIYKTQNADLVARRKALPQLHNHHALTVDLDVSELRLGSEHKISCAEQAQTCPHVVQLDGLPHVKDRKRRENRQSDNFLRDLQLSQAELRITDPVRRNLQKIFERSSSALTTGGFYMFGHSNNTASFFSILVAALIFSLSVAGVVAAQGNTSLGTGALQSNTTGSFNIASEAGALHSYLRAAPTPPGGGGGGVAKEPLYPGHSREKPRRQHRERDALSK